VWDPWGAWSFRVAAGGSTNGEERYQERKANVELSAGRVTARWKTTASVGTDRSRNRFLLEGGQAVVYQQATSWIHSLVVKSVGTHQAVGIESSLTQSTYENQDAALTVQPAVEFSLFPYSESMHRQLSARYSVGAVYLDYTEPTIYEEHAEARLRQTLSSGLSLTQPWGQVALGATASSYLPDWEKNRLTSYAYLQVRLLRGLAIEIDATGERVRDQLYLPGSEASDEDVLLRQRQLSTAFRYDASVGFSYTFGTSFSTVVNPRFGFR
jgi:hypothetical protein